MIIRGLSPSGDRAFTAQIPFCDGQILSAESKPNGFGYFEGGSHIFSKLLTTALTQKTPDSWRRKTTDGVFHCPHMSSPANSPPGVSLSCSVLFAWDHPNDGKCHNRNDLQPHGLCQQLTHLSAHWRKEVHDLAVLGVLQYVS